MFRSRRSSICSLDRCISRVFRPIALRWFPLLLPSCWCRSCTLLSGRWCQEYFVSGCWAGRELACAAGRVFGTTFSTTDGCAQRDRECCASTLWGGTEGGGDLNLHALPSPHTSEKH